MPPSTIYRSSIKTAACCSLSVKTVLNRVNSGWPTAWPSPAATKFLWRIVIIEGCRSLGTWSRENFKLQTSNFREASNSKLQECHFFQRLPGSELLAQQCEEDV